MKADSSKQGAPDLSPENGQDENHNGGVKETASLSPPVERPVLPRDGQPPADDIKVKVYKGKALPDKSRRCVSWSATEGGRKEEDKSQEDKKQEDMVTIQLEDSGEIIDVEAKFLEQVN